MNRHDEKWLHIAQEIGERWSKDPRTKVGAVIVDADNRCIGTGYNGFPKGILDDGRLNFPELKYPLIVHAEINAIINRITLDPFTLYTSFFPCEKCAPIIANTNCVRIVADRFYIRGNIELSKSIFNECNIPWEVKHEQAT